MCIRLPGAKSVVALLLAACCVSFAALPASAAAGLVTVTATQTPLDRGVPNSTPVVVTMQAQTAISASDGPGTEVLLLDGEWTSAFMSCNGAQLTSAACSSYVTVSAESGGVPVPLYNSTAPTATVEYSAGGVFSLPFTTDFPATTTITFTFAPGTIIANYPNVPTLQIAVNTHSAAIENEPVIDLGYAGIPLVSIVTFDANGGSGSMAPQSSGSATALTANAFTYSGRTFLGWNTAADGSGTSYADGASFPFHTNATLYAQWSSATSNTDTSASTPSSTVLAQTGSPEAIQVVASVLLMSLGIALNALRRRKLSPPHFDQ